jgi:hypothetical protein
MKTLMPSSGFPVWASFITPLKLTRSCPKALKTEKINTTIKICVRFMAKLYLKIHGYSNDNKNSSRVALKRNFSQHFLFNLNTTRRKITLTIFPIL